MLSVWTYWIARWIPRRVLSELSGYWAASKNLLHGFSRCACVSRRNWGLISYQLFGGSEDAYVREISFVDPATQTATITSVNLSLSQFATCFEQIQYSPVTLTKTSFTQTAEIQARMAVWRNVADGVEKWLVQRFEHNAQLGKIAFTDVLRSMWEERQPATT
jgi:hypothetical protein